ncbi:VPLPA-CTERM sorting domain-containing protein [Gymnodinialimonas sp. 2305UL16-5]|uniref:VPLPA-CTERM sorting domain-containing protein n=1 Tax=Gymnodinialimonas mytili TaxID=3126503 RepID=UPI00309B5D2A
MRIRTLTFATVLAALTAMPGLASTVTLNVVGGQLVGASNVEVNGALYDVEFVDGTCAALFDGCDAQSDFIFSTLDQALAAGRSLSETVFLDGPLGNFDSDPSLTAGIERSGPFSNQGTLLIPFAVVRDRALAADFFNGSPDPIGGNDDRVSAGNSILISYDTSQTTRSVYARFSPSDIAPVPLPAGGVLLLAGLVAFGALRARRRSPTAS